MVEAGERSAASPGIDGARDRLAEHGSIQETQSHKVKVPEERSRWSQRPGVRAGLEFKQFSVQRGASPSTSKADERRRLQWERCKKGLAIFPAVESLSYIAVAVPTDLKIENWKTEFADYDDQELLRWLEFGFPTLCDVEKRSVFAHNHGSFEQFREQSLQGIEEEIAAGRILEFDDGPPTDPLRVNPLGSVPKNRREVHKRRRTSDLSYPRGLAVNEGLRVEALPDLKFASVGDVVKRIQEMRAADPACKIFLCKLDVENAYRNLPVDMNDWWMLGYWVNGRYWWTRGCRLG